MERMVPLRESRISVSHTPDGVRIDIARRRPWWRWIGPPWIACVIGIGLWQFLAHDPSEEGGAVGFLIFWCVFGFLLLVLGLWGLLHREHLLVATRALVHTRELGPIRLRHAYERDRIEDVRVSSAPARGQLGAYGIASGTVAFDYGDRTIRVADVDEAEAKRVVAALAEAGL